MRPSPIIWFERVALLAFALGVLNLGAGWASFTARLHDPVQLAAFLLAQCIYFGVYLLLIWLIGRRGNMAARWIFAILVLAAAFLFVFVVLPPPPNWSLLQTVLAGAQCFFAMIGVGLIFGPDTGPWFRGRRTPVDPEIFR